MEILTPDPEPLKRPRSAAAKAAPAPASAPEPTTEPTCPAAAGWPVTRSPCEVVVHDEWTRGVVASYRSRRTGIEADVAIAGCDEEWTLWTGADSDRIRRAWD